MQTIERQVRREARAMSRREVMTKAIAKQLSWKQASEILGISARQLRRLWRKVERDGMSAVMDQCFRHPVDPKISLVDAKFVNIAI